VVKALPPPIISMVYVSVLDEELRWGAGSCGALLSVQRRGGLINSAIGSIERSVNLLPTRNRN
jgi:hypothetical protein